jgi:hypothetical protein
MSRIHFDLAPQPQNLHVDRPIVDLRIVQARQFEELIECQYALREALVLHLKPSIQPTTFGCCNAAGTALGETPGKADMRYCGRIETRDECLHGYK